MEQLKEWKQEKQNSLLRLKQVLERVPVSKSTWWVGVASGRFPQSVKHLGPRTTAWRSEDIDAVINGTFASKGV